MLISPPAGRAAQAMRDLLEVPTRTLARWRAWWQEGFQRTRFWHSVRERFVPPVSAASLPGRLLGQFQGSTCDERLVQLLLFVSPLSSAAM